MGATTQLFVGRLPRELRSSELERIFEKYGKLSRCDVKRGANLCYGFVEYEDINDAEDAMKQCNGLSVQGERIVVEFAKGAARKRDDNTCFRCNQEGRSRSRDRDRDRSRGRRNRNDRRESSRSRRHRSRSRSRSRSASPTRRHGNRSHRSSHHARAARSSRRSRSPSASRSRSRSNSRAQRARGGRNRGGNNRRHGARSKSPAHGRGAGYTDRDDPQGWDKKSVDSAVGVGAPEDGGSPNGRVAEQAHDEDADWNV
ncbi:hypothetical protein H4R99_004727 [Coemansia sp. RSA 1722]|nr:hypothetical protein H4R99_004727 [Coemansia sp. RSA 1722]